MTATFVQPYKSLAYVLVDGGQRYFWEKSPDDLVHPAAAVVFCGGEGKEFHSLIIYGFWR